MDAPDKAKSHGGLSTDSDRPIRFAGSVLGAQRHVCAFFHNADEQYRILLPFIKEGFECGDRAFHVLNSNWREEHFRRLESAGIAVAATRHPRQLEVATVEEAFLRGGRFNADATLVLIQEVLNTGAILGFPLTRFIAQVAERILEDGSNADEWIKCEARLNYILPRYNDPLICVYDLAKLRGAVVIDVLRTHPMVVIGGLLQENPFFVPPDEFLRQLREREAPQTT
jgi:DcmR-like sensory protein